MKKTNNPTFFKVRSTTKLSQIINAYFSRLGMSIDPNIAFLVDLENNKFDSHNIVDQCGFQNNDVLTIAC